MKKRRLDEILILLTIFINGLGFVIRIGGINVVLIFASMALITVMLNILKNPGSVSKLVLGKHRIILGGFIIWIVYAFIQGLMVDNDELYRQVLNQLITNFAVIFFVLYMVEDNYSESYRIILKVIYFVLIINTLMGMFEIITGVHFVEANSIWESANTRGLSENPNEYATTVFCSAMAVVLLRAHEKLKVHHYITLGAAVLCIIGSGSRGVLLAVLIFVISYMFLKCYLDYFNGSEKILKLILGVIFLVIAGMFIFIDVEETIMNIVNMYSKGNSLSDIYRLQLIKSGIEMFLESNWLGVGPGQSIDIVGINLHNFLLEILSEYGILIFIFVAYIFVSIWNTSFNKEMDNKKKAVYFAYVPSILIAGISSSSIHKFKLFWIVLIMFYLLKDDQVKNIE